MLDLMMTLVVPLTLGLVAVYAACRRVDVYDALIQGAGEGLGTLARIIPSLVGLMTAVYMRGRWIWPLRPWLPCWTG